MTVRILVASLLFAAALYWSLAAVLELITGAKPRGIFGYSILRGPQPAPMLSASMWRRSAVFLFAMAAALTLIGLRVIQGWF